MLRTPHFLVGATIGYFISMAGPAVLVALLSHFVLDAIPHTDTIGGHHINSANIYLNIADVALALLLFLILFKDSSNLVYIFIIGIVAILPDIIEIPGLFWEGWYKLPIVSEYHHWHTEVLQYSKPKVNWFWGLLPQIVVIIAIFLIVTIG